MSRIAASQTRFLMLTFAVGCVVSILASVLSSPRGTTLFLGPLFWAWSILAWAAGTTFADNHRWLVILLAAPVHGLVLSFGSLVADTVLKPFFQDASRRHILVLAAGAACYVWLLSWVGHWTP
jgi:hypothetical protein